MIRFVPMRTPRMMTTELLRPSAGANSRASPFLVIQYIMYTHTLAHTVHLQKTNQSKKSHEWTY